MHVSVGDEDVIKGADSFRVHAECPRGVFRLTAKEQPDPGFFRVFPWKGGFELGDVVEILYAVPIGCAGDAAVPKMVAEAHGGQSAADGQLQVILRRGLRVSAAEGERSVNVDVVDFDSHCVAPFFR